MPKPFGFHAQRPADVHELLQACVKEPRSASGAYKAHVGPSF